MCVLPEVASPDRKVGRSRSAVLYSEKAIAECRWWYEVTADNLLD